MLAQAHEGYASGARRMRTPRAIEYDAFARVTAGLRNAERSGDFPALAQAVHENRQLWSLLAADLVEPANGFPDTLKARLLSLASFSFAEGGRVLSRVSGIDALIAINTAMMRGLNPGEVGA